MTTRFFFAIVAAFITSSPLVRGDQASNDFSCKIWDLRIEAPDHIYLRCASGWPTTQPYLEIWREPDDSRDAAVDITGAGSILPKNADGFLEIRLASALTGNRKYLLFLKRTPDRNPVDLKVELNTEPKALINAGLAQAERGKVFRIGGGLGTHIAFSEAATQELLEQNSPSGTVHKIPAKAVITTKANPNCEDDPLCLGRVNVTVDRRLRASKETVALPDLKDVFGQTVDTKNTVDLAAPPKGKDDADQYYQLSYKAGPGSKPSLAINAKTNTLLGWFGNPTGSFYVGRYLVQPSAVIDVGTNDFAQKSDNRIVLGLKSSRTRIVENGSAFFQGTTFGPGFAYETNLGFKKNNFLITYDSRLYFKDLYRTREQRRFDYAAANNLTSLDAVDPEKVKFGYGIELLPGVEGGGSPLQQMVNNKPKTAQLNVDPYPILRFKPTLHSFVEYDRFTLDWSGTMRMLTFTELVGQETPDHKLYLRSIRGLQNYMEVTGSIGIDESKHTSLSVTYKRGAQPPAYPHAQTVLTGFTVKF